MALQLVPPLPPDRPEQPVEMDPAAVDRLTVKTMRNMRLLAAALGPQDRLGRPLGYLSRALELHLLGRNTLHLLRDDE